MLRPKWVSGKYGKEKKKKKENVGNEKNMQAVKLKILSYYLIFCQFSFLLILYLP